MWKKVMGRNSRSEKYSWLKKQLGLLLLLLFLVCMLLSACSDNQGSNDNILESAAGDNNNVIEQSFPFKDEEGRMRYKLEINGSEVQTKNLPFTYPNEPKGGYYPVVDVLSHMGVDCLYSEDETTLITRINGDVLTVSAATAEIIYGKNKFQSDTATPVIIDGCLYVPSFLFMVLFDDGVVDFSGDRSTATLETNATIDLASTGTAGLSIPSTGALGIVGAGSGAAGLSEQLNCSVCRGTGRSICTYCSGTGSKIEYQQAYDPVSKTYKQTQKRVFCPVCGASGTVTCPSCGGSGRR